MILYGVSDALPARNGGISPIGTPASGLFALCGDCRQLLAELFQLVS